MPHPPAPLIMIEPKDAACLILASGRGVRMGGPKALLLWTDGLPLAVSHVRARRDVGASVVVGRAAVMARLRSRLPEARLIASSAPGPWGPAGSIAAAVRAGVLNSSPWVLITPVDLVPTRVETVAALIGVVGPEVDAVRPLCEGRGGHPVLVRNDVLHRVYLSPGEPPTLRDVLRALGSRCVSRPVEDLDIRTDLDTPEAYRARTGHPPRFAG